MIFRITLIKSRQWNRLKRSHWILHRGWPTDCIKFRPCRELALTSIIIWQWQAWIRGCCITFSILCPSNMHGKSRESKWEFQGNLRLIIDLCREFMTFESGDTLIKRERGRAPEVRWSADMMERAREMLLLSAVLLYLVNGVCLQGTPARSVAAVY